MIFESDVSAQLTPEERARVLIDARLTQAGWSVQDRSAQNLIGHRGVTLREKIMAASRGRADHILDVDRRVVGVIGAKPLRSRSQNDGVAS